MKVLGSISSQLIIQPPDLEGVLSCPDRVKAIPKICRPIKVQDLTQGHFGSQGHKFRDPAWKNACVSRDKLVSRQVTPFASR